MIPTYHRVLSSRHHLRTYETLYIVREASQNYQSWLQQKHNKGQQGLSILRTELNMKQNSFFCITLSSWRITWLNSVIVVWKMTPFASKLVSNKPCFYQDIFFATGTRVSWKNEKSVMLSVHSVQICRSMLRFLATGDVGTSWLAHRTQPCLCQKQCLSAWAQTETDQFTPLRLSLQPFNLQTGFKNESHNKRNKAQDGRLQRICFPTSLMLQLS